MSLFDNIKEKVEGIIYSRYFPGSIYTIAFVVWWLMIFIALFENDFVVILQRFVDFAVPIHGLHLSQYITVKLVMEIWWIFWWPITIFSVVFVSRGWCGWICPLGATSEFMNKFGFGKSVPSWIRWAWLPFFSFLIVVLSERAFGMLGLPKASAYFFIVLMAVAALYGIFILRRAWCLTLCPIGMLLGVFSRLGILHFTTDEKKCKDCNDNVCAQVCPTYINIHKTPTKRHCIMCFRCAKECPYNAVKLEFRKPSLELLDVDNSKPDLAESTYVLMTIGLFLGIFILQPAFYVELERWFNEKVGIKLMVETFALGNINAIAFFGFILMTMVIVISLGFMMSLLSHSLIKSKLKKKFSNRDIITRSGYIYAPFSFAGLFVVTSEGLLFKFPSSEFLRISILGIGLIWSSILAFEIIKSQGNLDDTDIIKSISPHILLLAALFGIFFWVILPTAF